MLKCSPTFTPSSHGLPIPSSRSPDRLLPALRPRSIRSRRDHRGPRAPLPGMGVTQSQDGLSDHLREHYPSFLAPTSPCARPASSQRLGCPCTLGLCRLLRAPAGCWPFPTLSLPSLWRCSDPYPVVSASCTCPFLHWRRRPHARRDAFGTRDDPCKATSTGGTISGLQSFDHLRAPPLARPPDRTHRGHMTGRPGRLRHASPGQLPDPGCGIATCLTWATGTAGPPPAR
jgi:hypothetical protein